MNAGPPASASALVLLALSATLTACGSPKRELTLGAVDDASKWAPNARQPMQLAANAGLKAIVLSAVWKQGASASADLPPLRRAVRAAKAEGLEPQLAVYQLSSSTPLDDASRTAFSEYAVALVRALPSVRTVLVGNEPNLNLFWMPQFDSSGGDAAAAAYVQLLATTYDALKSVDPKLTIVGGNLAPRGGDDPSASRQTHSPTRSSRISATPTARAVARSRCWTCSRSTSTASRPRSRRRSRIPTRRRSESPTTTSSSRCSARRSMAPRSRARTCRSSTASTASRPNVPSERLHGHRGRANGRTSRRRPATTAQAIALAACQQTFACSTSSMCSTSGQLTGLQSGLYYARRHREAERRLGATLRASILAVEAKSRVVSEPVARRLTGSRRRPTSIRPTGQRPQRSSRSPVSTPSSAS